MIIDAPVLTEPRTWRITKVNRLSSRGLCMATCAQDTFDQHKDYIELGENGEVIGMWADYFKSEVLPTDPEPSIPIKSIIGKFTWSALPQLKVGGSYKKFTLTFYENEEEIDFLPGNYYFTIDNKDASNLITTIEDSNTIKVKFNGDDSWIGKVMTIKYVTETGVTASVDVEIIGL